MSVVEAVPWESLRGLVVITAAVFSILIVASLARTTELSGIRGQFLHGVPWGTLLTITSVTLVYLFVQGGFEHPTDPLVVPFRSWSYYYPLGMLTAAFSHASRAHLLGNLIATLAYVTVAEFAWGHYPRRRGVQTFTSPLTNPYVRILVVPASAFVVGLFTSLFALGPVVGFSGVVYAFAGFALLSRPLLAVFAIFGARIVNALLTAVLNPRTVSVPRPRVVTPWWADVAIQGHAIGIFAGFILAIGLAWSRDEWPDPHRLWFAVIAFAIFQGLWAIYAPLDGGRYVLYRWLGIAVIFLLAAIIVVAATRSGGPELPWLDVNRRTVAFAIVCVLLVSMSASAVAYNVAPVDQQPIPEPTVQVRDYAVSYGENVPHGYVSAVSVPFVDVEPSVNTSGIIVTSDRRYVWRTMVRSAVLKNRGRASILVGGVGWRERVYANRTGWTVSGGGSVYKVYLQRAGEPRTLAYTSENATANVVLEGRNVTMEPARDQFQFVVSQNGTVLGTAPVPGTNETSAAGGIAFNRTGPTVYASVNQTRLVIAKREVPE